MQCNPPLNFTYSKLFYVRGQCYKYIQTLQFCTCKSNVNFALVSKERSPKLRATMTQFTTWVNTNNRHGKWNRYVHQNDIRFWSAWIVVLDFSKTAFDVFISSGLLYVKFHPSANISHTNTHKLNFILVISVCFIKVCSYTYVRLKSYSWFIAAAYLFIFTMFPILSTIHLQQRRTVCPSTCQ
jgi:hypothetical protein